MPWAYRTHSELLVCLIVFYKTVYMTLSADVTLTCPQFWDTGEDNRTLTSEPVLLTCVVIKKSVREKCSGSAPKITSFNHQREGQNTSSMCVVSARQYDNCSFVPDGQSSGCGCAQNTTHYTFIYRLVGEADVPADIYEGNWTCTKNCTSRVGSVENPLTKDISPFCTNVKIRVCRGKTCNNRGTLNRTTCLCRCVTPWFGQNCTVHPEKDITYVYTLASWIVLGTFASGVVLVVVVHQVQSLFHRYKKKNARDKGSFAEGGSSFIARNIPSSVSYDTPSKPETY